MLEDGDMKTCSKCGEIKPLGEFSTKGVDRNGNKRVNGRCKPCHKSYMKSYYSDNKGTLLEKMKAKRDDPVTGAEIRERKRQYTKTQRGRELQAIRASKHYESNKEAIKRRAMEWEKSKGPEYSKIRHAVWRSKNRDAARSHVRKRRELLKLAGELSVESLKSRLDYYGWKCIYCGSSDKLEVEHRIPLSRGGTNLPANLVPACKSCNCKKGTKTETEFKILLSQEQSV